MGAQTELAEAAVSRSWAMPAATYTTCLHHAPATASSAPHAGGTVESELRQPASDAKMVACVATLPAPDGAV